MIPPTVRCLPVIFSLHCFLLFSTGGFRFELAKGYFLSRNASELQAHGENIYQTALDGRWLVAAVIGRTAAELGPRRLGTPTAPRSQHRRRASSATYNTPPRTMSALQRMAARPLARSQLRTVQQRLGRRFAHDEHAHHDDGHAAPKDEPLGVRPLQKSQSAQRHD